MLKEWILQIRQDSRYYCIESWKYRISGNVLELSVTPADTKNKQVYRCSVITVGQVLRALSCKIEDADSHFLIQSFPAIESPEIIASIRMDKNSYHTDTFPPCSPDYKPGDTVLSRVQTLSRLYQFSLHPCTKPDKTFLPETEDADLKRLKWYALASQFDNPFTWLNVGYWKESLQKDCRNFVIEKPWPITDFCNHSATGRLDIKIPDQSFLQAAIGIPKAAAAR